MLTFINYFEFISKFQNNKYIYRSVKITPQAYTASIHRVLFKISLHMIFVRLKLILSFVSWSRS